MPPARQSTTARIATLEEATTVQQVRPARQAERRAAACARVEWVAAGGVRVRLVAGRNEEEARRAAAAQRGWAEVEALRCAAREEATLRGRAEAAEAALEAAVVAGEAATAEAAP